MPCGVMPALYLFDEMDKLDDGFPERCIPFLSEQRRKKAFMYRFLPDRKLSVAAYLLLRLALTEKRGIDEPVVFAYEQNGKPSLRDYPHIHFNLSHCRGAAACVISDAAAGVDVQEIAPVPDGLARRVLTTAEYAAYKASPCPDELFCEIWTKKESLLKQTGQGIGVDLTAIEAGNAGMLFRGKNYYGCVSGAPAPITRVGAHGFARFC